MLYEYFENTPNITNFWKKRKATSWKHSADSLEIFCED